MEKILNELMKSETPYNEGTHRRISSMLNVPMRKVSEMATRFRESLEQIGMVRNQMSRMVHPENREQLEQQRRELLCPLPTDEEWREADARSMAAQEVVIDQALARLATDSYYEFVKQAFAVLEPETKYVDNWHVEYLCNTIQSMVERVGRHEPNKRNIIINIPPRAMKSVITTICIVPWAWIHFPHLEFIASSYSAALSLEHSSKARRIIESPWYKRHWGDRYQLQGDENQKSNYENTRMGRRTAVSTGGTANQRLEID